MFGREAAEKNKTKDFSESLLENLQNYKDLYGKPLERDWRAKRLLLIQILLISNAHKNSPLKDINLKICM